MPAFTLVLCVLLRRMRPKAVITMTPPPLLGVLGFLLQLRG
ncbi:hypothetical protein [uncultured Paludibaculum sp.]|nr:hypothetical protein [uncultured Paludibaculum sp.]